MDEMKQTFLEEYKKLCLKYNIRIGIGCNESGTEIWQDIEEMCLPQELAEHFEDLEKTP